MSGSLWTTKVCISEEALNAHGKVQKVLKHDQTVTPR